MATKLKGSAAMASQTCSWRQLAMVQLLAMGCMTVALSAQEHDEVMSKLRSRQLNKPLHRLKYSKIPQKLAILANTEVMEIASDPDLNGTEVVTTDGDLSRIVEKAVRRRRSNDDGCAPLTRGNKNLMRTLTAQATHAHAFPQTTGTLLIAWARDSMEEMLVSTQRPNSAQSLFFSKDGGKTFSNPLERSVQITLATFSDIPLASEKYAAIALPNSTGPPTVYYSTDSGAHWQPKVLTQRVGLKFQDVSWSPSPSYATTTIMAHSYVSSANMTFVPYLINVATAASVSLLPQDATAPAISAEWSQLDDDISDDSAGKVWILTASYQLFLVTISGSDRVASSRLVSVENPVEFYQSGSFVFAETTYSRNDTNTSHRSLMVSNDGQQFFRAHLPIDSLHSSNTFEILYANEQEIMLAAQHSHIRTQGVANVELSYDVEPTVVFNASRALFSEVLPVPASASPFPLMFDAANALGCNATSQPPAGGSPFVQVVFRGSCLFVDKLQNAIDIGAAGVIVINQENSRSVYMAPPAGHDTSTYGSIPMLLISRDDGCHMFGTEYCNETTVDAIRLRGKTVKLYEDMVTAKSLFSYSNLYTSDSSGAEFSKSLANINLVPSGDTEYVDLYEVVSLEGTFLANVRGLTTTLISRNKGAMWSPVTDVNGLDIQLALETNFAAFGWPTPVSVPMAPGIIVANALGNHSSENRPSIYISRDAGMTWAHSIPPNIDPPQPFYFEILDHGSVIAMLPAASTTKSAYISLDEGSNVVEIPLDSLQGLAGDWQTDPDCSTASNNSQNTVYSCLPSEDGSKLRCSVKNSADAYLFEVDPTTDRRLTWTEQSGGARTGTCFQNLDNYQSSSSSYCSVSGTKTVRWTGGTLLSPECWVRAESLGKQVQGTVADPRATGTALFLYWADFVRTNGRTLVDWIGIRMDVQLSLLTPPIGTGECDTDDYGAWNPDSTGYDCSMGLHRVFTRKKQCSVCRNGRDHVVEVDGSNCPCGNTDKRCNYGYLRPLNLRGDPAANSSEQCVHDPDVEDTAAEVTSIIPKDTCGRPDPTQQPNTQQVDGSGGSPTMIIVIIVVVVLVVVGVGGAYKFGYLNRILKSKPRGPTYMGVGNDLSISADDSDDDDEELLDDEAMA